MLDLKTVEELPKTKRGGGRHSEERKQIQDALLSGKPTVIENVGVKNEFNALHQRIRMAGQAIGIKVTVRHIKHDDGKTCDVYFAAKDETDG